MVGIPRSGGCHTCRRRRIRCDQQRPNCRRCFTDGKTCEGYERWATFVNRTPAGLQRRQRMEEAIIPRPRPGPVPLANRALLGRFLDIYLPTAPHDRGSATEVWLVEACQLDQPAPVLRLALHALAGSRVGAADNSLALVNESQQAYGESLSLLHRILGSSGSVIDDQVLAASRCLMIFEVFSATTSSGGAWESHVKGLINIAMIRGPQGFTSPFSSAILTDIKAGSMLGCVHHSARSPFTDGRWGLMRDPRSVNEVEVLVLHHGLDLAALYADEEAARAAGVLDDDKLRQLVRRLDGLAAELAYDMTILARLRPPPAATAPPAATLADRPAAPTADKEFWGLESAVMTAIVLTLLLDASFSVHDMLNRLTGDTPPATPERQSLAPFIESHEAEAWHDELGWRVVSAAAYMTQASMGVYGGQRAMFPLWMMLNILPRELAAYGRAEALYIQGIAGRKMRHPLDLPHPDNKPNKRLLKGGVNISLTD